MTVKSMLSGILAAAALTTGAGAAPLTPEANLSDFKPASGNDGLIATEGARPWESATPFDLKFWLDYAHRPVARTSAIGELIENRTGAWFTADLHVLEPLTLAIALPFTLNERGTLSLQPSGNQAVVQSSGLGDVRITPRLGLLRQETSGLDLAVQATLELPSSDRHLLTTWGEPVAEGLVSVGHRYGEPGSSIYFLANAFAFTAPNRTVDGQNVGAGFGGRFGVSVDAVKGRFSPTRVFGEIEAKSMPRLTLTEGPTPAEARGGASWCFGPGFTFDVAVGGGLNDAPGAPSFRVVSGLGFGANACSTEAAELQAKKAAAAKLVAEKAAADKAAADKAAVDNALAARAAADKAYADQVAAEKAAAEKSNQFAADKAAADAAALAALKDTDGDGVPDSEDNCPNEPGPASNHGCPLSNKQMVAVTAEGIQILDKVEFAIGKAVISAKSFKLLDQVAGVLNQHTEMTNVEVQGHSDAQGNPEKNTVLSQARADAVLNYLVKKGVAPSRLTAKGYGPTVPIADNATVAGREKNRRVEFKVTK